VVSDSESKTILDHIAVVVEDLDQGEAFYQSLGLEFDQEREVVPSQGVATSFAPIDWNSSLELLSPLADEGPVYDFIKKRGAGIHHVAFQVPDIHAKCAELKELGHTLLYPEPREGARRRLVNFVHPKSSKGVLVEITQVLAPPEEEDEGESDE
jgi:methylmalonyl-CoA/ethylmalonyl-CoA epimerase